MTAKVLLSFQQRQIKDAPLPLHRPTKIEETATAENGGQVGHNFRGIKTRDIVAEGTEDSARTIQRYIRLTELSPELQQMVDDKKIAMTPAVEISYLKPEEQALLMETIESEQSSLSKPNTGTPLRSWIY